MICRASEQQAAVSAVIMEKKLSRMELTTSEWSLTEKVLIYLFIYSFIHFLIQIVRMMALIYCV